MIGLRETFHKSHISWENLWFPLDFSLSQPIDNICPNKITMEQGPAQTWQVPRVPVHPWSAPWGRRPRKRGELGERVSRALGSPGQKDTKTGGF